MKSVSLPKSLVRRHFQKSRLTALLFFLSVRKQYFMTKPLYTKRKNLISKIEHFWALALELAPQEIDQFVQPSDSGVFADSLLDLEVTRFELDAEADNASPRSFSVKLTFGPNEWFEDSVLEKKFWYRHSKHHGTGLVSEPVKINWKPGKDLSQGLTDAAVKLWNAMGQRAAEPGKSIAELPEYKALAALLEENDRSSVSFFTFFAFISENTYVSAEESAAAATAADERRKKRARGEEVNDDEDEKEQEAAAQAVADFEDVEVCPHGAELGTVIADEFWPNALKYFGKLSSHVPLSRLLLY